MESNYPEIVQKIHKEFFKKTNTNKSARLYNQGFLNAKNSISDKLSKLESYYRVKYPLYRFITKERVDKICNKYGLVVGKFKWYNGFVPEEKLLQIEQFRVDDIDCCKYYESTYDFDLGRRISFSELPEEVKRFFATNKNTQCTIKKGIFNKKRYYNRVIDGKVMVAPVTQFNIPDGYEVNKHKITKVVEDPIILQKVKGGYLIVCAWGDEASDSEVINLISN